ncbi:helix-turn-helix domain-containing protein [Kitasatospora sp. NPDC057542]|uniref:helix-turn-helix domain-containing protein n=1 Tax=Kitasatospora sp. NPDC057542 TaxID=3346162 RepID=UPI0036ACFB84
MKTTLTCHQCKTPFRRPCDRGRIPKYCPACRAKGATSTDHKGEKLGMGKLVRARDAEAAAVSRSVAERGVEINRLTRMPQPLRALEQVMLVEQDLEDLKAHLIQQARHQGHDWDAIGETLSLSAKYVARRYNEEYLRRRRRNRGRRTASAGAPAFRLAADAALAPALVHPAAVESQPREVGAAEAGDDTAAEDDAPPGQRGERRDAARLSRALSHLQRSSGTTIRALSQAAEVSPSFVCRVLSGHKMPSWPITRSITEACGANPDDLRILWQTAQGARPRPPVIRRNDDELFTEALATLRSALRGLHLAAFSPPPALVCEQVDGPLSPRDVTGLLDKETEATSLPDWPVIGQVVDALNADADMVRPLWEHAQVARDPYWTPEHGASRSTLPVFG